MKKHIRLITFIVILILFGCMNDNITEINMKFPACNISEPDNNSSYERTDNITLKIKASDEDGEVSNYVIYVDDILQDEFNSNSYDFSPELLSVGEHELKITVFDNDSLYTSDSLVININNTIPVCSISSPANNSDIKQSMINIMANANDEVAVQGVK